MTETEAAAPVLDAVTAQGLAGSVKYLCQQYLDSSHYDHLHSTVSDKWDRLHSLSAATKLMEQYGVQISPEETERLSQMDEMQQINQLVMKMPQQSNETFQHFFLQLQLIVSTATRVRQALEQGRDDVVEQTLDEADDTGIAAYILKMALVQAGSEVTVLKTHYMSCCADWDAKMAKLIRGQEDAMQAQRRLAVAQETLSQYTTGSNEKAKKVLMAIGGGNGKFLAKAVMGEWHLYVKRQQEEAEIRAEYEERIENAEAKLMEFKTSQLTKTRSMLSKKGAEKEQDLVFDVYRIWKEAVEETKFMAENSAKVAAMEAKLAQYKEGQSANTKAVMMRMQAGGDQACLMAAFQGWLKHHQNYAQDKATEDAVKEAEARVQQFLANKKDGAKGLLNKMSDSTNTGLMKESLDAWMQMVAEAKKEREIEEALNAANSKFASFGARGKDSAKSVSERARMMLDEQLRLQVIGAWRLVARMEATLVKFQSRIEGKKHQLVGVQMKFRNFAVQLESQISGADSARDPGKKMKKTEGTVSLPDIHSKQGMMTPNGKGSSRAGKSPMMSPQAAY